MLTIAVQVSPEFLDPRLQSDLAVTSDGDHVVGLAGTRLGGALPGQRHHRAADFRDEE